LSHASLFILYMYSYIKLTYTNKKSRENKFSENVGKNGYTFWQIDTVRHFCVLYIYFINKKLFEKELVTQHQRGISSLQIIIFTSSFF